VLEIDNFIVPAKDLIVGPFKGRGQHVCLTDRLWYRHATPLLDEGRNQEDVRCSHHCAGDQLEGEHSEAEGEHSLEQVLFATQTRNEILKYAYEQELVASPPYMSHSPITNNRTLTPEPAPIDFFEILDMWQDIIIAHADNTDEDSFLTVDAQNVEDAANAVFYALREIATGIPAPSLSSTTAIKNANLTALNAPRFIAHMSASILFPSSAGC
jgi:hypothetical protein